MRFLAYYSFLVAALMTVVCIYNPISVANIFRELGFACALVLYGTFILAKENKWKRN